MGVLDLVAVTQDTLNIESRYPSNADQNTKIN